MAVRTWPSSSTTAIAAAVGTPSPVEGVPLALLAPAGRPMDSLLIAELAGMLAGLACMRKESLPALPPGWPSNERDGKAFLEAFAGLTERQFIQPNWPQFGWLFAVFGVREDGLARFVERVPAMTRRPYSLLHTDLDRDKVVVTYNGRPPLSVTSPVWTAVTYGDPLFGLASHLVRMGYPNWQWNEVIAAWAQAVQRIRPAAANGHAKDLRHYVDFEYACAAYADVIAAASSLGTAFDAGRLGAAAVAVRGALKGAARPLRLARVPEDDEIGHALLRWQVAHAARQGGSLPPTAVRWVPDLRVPESADFPHAAVTRALTEEGAAPAGRVFAGTAHLNSVVEVPGRAGPVVVRRKVDHTPRLERRFLNEHAVLAAVEYSGVAVRAPRVLAMGQSDGGETFAIHTYEGPHAGDEPPDHPVDGLLPYEADELVDQLASLTYVDYEQLDPDLRSLNFFGALAGELVRLVGDLSPEVQRLARSHGLPDYNRLRELLSRYTVAPRRPVLLHGDLSPWNLVRGHEQGTRLTIIDWEMAMIGDPLYDLVRHMHLTPTKPEIRKRVFSRWSRLLPEECTRGWRDDWRVYRRIEVVRSAYVDLARLVTADSPDAPNVRRAVETYAMTLADTMAVLGLPGKSTANPYLVRALPHTDHGGQVL
ncbi:phosphotransferase family protein [Streptomyces sp. NPDC058614]|uniref:phosphotransferase family protein n=1 Tax=Streptomyces sp. NPDC058614 TaxID=3346557 RepID=UPI0036698A09